jgi:spermidine synthase
VTKVFPHGRDGVSPEHGDRDDGGHREDGGRVARDFEYGRWIADVIDLIEPPGGPLRIAHIGGAACSLPRYVAATRPESRQVVFEIDPGVLDAAREAFGIRSGRLLKLRVGDGRDGLSTLSEASLDVVVRDAFSGALVPRHLTTRQFIADVTRVLAPGGIYLANLADAPPLAKARDEVATLLAAFRQVVLIAEPAQFSGRRFGNVVVAGSQERLPVEGLVRRLASAAVRARMLATNEARSFASGRRPLDDEPVGLPR